MASQHSQKVNYHRLAKDEEGQISSESLPETSKPDRLSIRVLSFVAAVVFSAVAGFLVGSWRTREAIKASNPDFSASTAPRIPIPYTADEFEYGSPFSLEPPRGKGADEIAEPVWDALVPNGLGYFRDGDLAPKVSIPTTFHQLHCLYVLRRAFYSTRTQDDQLEAFDFGKNRTKHAAHCFDYLKQTITCSVDSTIEPYEPEANKDGFLGAGFPRQCRSFEALKQYVEKWRVFNATGFLAKELGHGGKAQIHGSK